MGVRKTVVFADLIGSTGVFEAVGNVEAARTVTELTRWIGQVCVAHQGRVVKTLGDGVLMVFPDGQPAIDAVVEIQRSHQRRVLSNPEPLRMPLKIGVASGEVEMVEGDCFGDAVNVASRLSDLTGAHQIWANSDALDYVTESGGVRFRTLGPINIRGRAEPCTVYQIEWREEQTTDFLTVQGQIDPGLMDPDADPLGRQIELRWLDDRKIFKSFELPVLIGRVRQVEFAVNDPRVSRTHARIEWRNGSVMLVDVSTFGSWVRFSGAGSDLLLRREECVLHGTGEIALGASFADLSVPTVVFSVS